MDVYVSPGSATGLQAAQAAKAGVFTVLDGIVAGVIPEGHPFEHGVNAGNAESVMSEYFAMSEAFPYIQAGASKELWQTCVSRNADVGEAARVTSVVGAFLCWDEVGGYAKALAGGRSTLPNILETGAFHSEMLRRDIEALFGKNVGPNYTFGTRLYLERLGEGLASFDPVERAAFMVAFESHAGTMITALWNGLRRVFGEKAEPLEYFVTHVGGEDPGEAYHIQMTAGMIDRVVSDENLARFYDAFKRAYAINAGWCASLVDGGKA